MDQPTRFARSDEFDELITAAAALLGPFRKYAETVPMHPGANPEDAVVVNRGETAYFAVQSILAALIHEEESPRSWQQIIFQVGQALGGIAAQQSPGVASTMLSALAKGIGSGIRTTSEAFKAKGSA